MKKLYIGNLSYSTKEESLRDFFAEYAPILSVRIMTDKFTNQSRGFGFVELEDSARAEAAIKELDSKMLDGKQLKVNESRPQEDRSGGGRSGSGSSKGNRSFRGNGRYNSDGRFERRSNW